MDQAPVFGSGPEYGSLEAFVVGDWSLQQDASSSSQPSALATTFAASNSQRLWFKADHTVNYAVGMSVVHGKWVVGVSTVQLQAVDVDGVPEAQVRSATGMHQSSADPLNTSAVQASALKLFDELSPIALHKDNKRLVSGNGSGGVLGGYAWVRMR